MIDFVTFKWTPPFAYRSTFTGEHVNTLARMIGRHYAGDWRLTCVTDDPSGIDPSIRVVDLAEWDCRGLGGVPSPHAGANPSCYRRLKLWSAQAAEIIGGNRLCSIDLDCVIVGDLAPIVDRPEPCVLWGDYVNRTTHYNGSMQLITPGAFESVFSDFNPSVTPKKTLAAGFHGSDQAWLSMYFGPNAAKWKAEDGVLSYRIHCRRKGLPDGARVVFFHGPFDPWLPQTQAEAPWIKDHYR